MAASVEASRANPRKAVFGSAKDTAPTVKSDVVFIRILFCFNLCFINLDSYQLTTTNQLIINVSV